MNDVLLQIGLNRKEAEIYMYLLTKGPQTTLQLSEATGEKRTNVYMILDRLTALAVVTADDTKSSRLFAANDPQSLRQLLIAEQQRQNQVSTALSAAMPRLKSIYALSNDKPGVVHLTGLDGFQSVLDDMEHSTGDVLLIAGDTSLGNKDAYGLLQKSLQKRAAAGICTRAIFKASSRETLDKMAFSDKNFEVRFLGAAPYPSELAIYESNVLFTNYEPSVLNTVITDANIATTLRQLFEELWSKAKI